MDNSRTPFILALCTIFVAAMVAIVAIAKKPRKKYAEVKRRVDDDVRRSSAYSCRRNA